MGGRDSVGRIFNWDTAKLFHVSNPAGFRYITVSLFDKTLNFLNHTVRYYNLRENLCKKDGGMGKNKNREMMFWNKEQYLKFAEVMMDKPLSFYAFEMLY